MLWLINGLKFNKMTPQELAKEIILTHAKKHHFEYEWLFKKWGKKGVKMYNGIHLDHHKQILTLYIKDNIEIPHTHLAKLLDRKSTRLNSSHSQQSRMPSSA